MLPHPPSPVNTPLYFLKHRNTKNHASGVRLQAGLVSSGQCPPLHVSDPLIASISAAQTAGSRLLAAAVHILADGRDVRPPISRMSAAEFHSSVPAASETDAAGAGLRLSHQTVSGCNAGRGRKTGPVFCLPVGQFAPWAQSRMSIVAACALVAVPWGLRVLSLVPLMIPEPQVHCMAGMAYSLIWAKST